MYAWQCLELLISIRRMSPWILTKVNTRDRASASLTDAEVVSLIKEIDALPQEDKLELLSVFNQVILDAKT